MKQTVLRDATRRIVETFHPERIVLFGSHAYGKPGGDSDVDLLIIMESDQTPARRAAAVHRLLQERPFPLDVVVCTPREVRRRLAGFDPFLQEVMRKGRVLYAAR